MPHIENETVINAPLECVYQMAKDLESFPAFMPDVESIVVTERSPDGTRTVADWVGIAEQFKLKVRWTEEDIWDDVAHTCCFTQLKGDYKEYGGLWTFTSLPDGGTCFASAIDYNYDIPLIGPLLKTMIARLMKDNAQRILDAIKARAETQS